MSVSSLSLFSENIVQWERLFKYYNEPAFAAVQVGFDIGPNITYELV